VTAGERAKLLDRALLLAGKMADAAIRVTGGQGFNFYVREPSVSQLGPLLAELRKAVEAYNAAIIAAGPVSERVWREEKP
jgi:hypothetical protein